MRGKKLNDRITTYRISLAIYYKSFESPNILNPDIIRLDTPGMDLLYIYVYKLHHLTSFIKLRNDRTHTYFKTSPS